MVETDGGSSGTRKKGRGDHDTQPPQLVGVNEKGEPILLQSLPPQSNQQTETPSQKPDVFLLPWKDNVSPDESNSEHRDHLQIEHSATDEGMGMHVPPTVDDSGKNVVSGLISTERVASTKTQISLIRVNQEGRNLDSQYVEVVNIVEVNPERVIENVESVQPNVKDTSVKTSNKSTKTQSSVDPIVVEILAEMSKSMIGGVSGSRKKKRLRK
ncbi:hypothetical protein LIER_13882 [Lithospermum erythrorhizon]|uniref:Uncharacterized protein n=1 Tax=Lithospermum erythrorhizon TaxID=34254 RepID=A0AAV3PYK4_LITER